METLISNVNGKVRRAKLHGRDYLVVPMRMLVSGVLAGSQGPLYYPPEEIARNPGDWNGMPILLRHPTANGMPISGRDPEVWDRQALGFVFNAQANGPLDAEGWLDSEWTKRIAPDVYDTLHRGGKMELSTGLFTQNEQAPPDSHHNGMPYSHIARGYKPDHLAILPDAVGACSLVDGCGVLVNESTTPQGDKDVNKEQLIGWLTVNCDCWKAEGDKAILNAMTEEKLAQLKSAVEANAARNTELASVATAVGLTANASVKEIAEAVKVKVQTPTPPPVVNRLTPEELEDLAFARTEKNRQKAVLVERLIANVADPEARQKKGERFMQKPIEELQDLVELIPATPAFNQQYGMPNFREPLPASYFGAAGGPPTVNAKDDSQNLLPTFEIDYGTAAK